VKNDPGAPWSQSAPALAAWADKRLVGRRDAYGGYYSRDGATHQTTKKADGRDGPLTLKTLERHFQATGTNAIVGLHSTYLDERRECWSRWGAVDIDAHPGQPCDPEANLRYALALYAVAVGLGFKPLLFDSNGRGGYHLWVIFDAPVPTRTVFAFLRWLIRDWEAHGLAKPPEGFPKQPGIGEGKFGNWLRLPGRHHTRDHHTRVWDGEGWLEGAKAIRLILQSEGTSEAAIPAEARPDPAAPSDLGRDVGRARSDGDDSPHKPKRERADGAVYPGDDFNARASWREILEPHGWVLDHESEGVGFWRRPGKHADHSATTNHNDNDTLYVFTCNAPPFVQDGSYSKFGAHTLLNHGGNFSAAARALSRDGFGTRAQQTADGDGAEDGRETQAQALLRLASDADLTWTDGRAYARVPVGNHRENHEVRSAGFKRWLTREFYREKVRPPTSDALQGALGVLEARAQFDGSTEPVHVRVAPGDGGTVCIDLGDDSWRAVRVGPDGWSLVETPPVRFRRPPGLRALPTPEPGGTIRDLLGFVNVAEDDSPLLVAWITAALLPAGPYPALTLTGEQGSAKSTLARLLRLLIDPHASPLRTEPKEPRDLMISATNGWVVALDNLSGLSAWLSDALCRLATGGGFATRRLYSDDEEVFLDAQRPVILTGIDDFVRRGDLADRAIFLHLPAIPEAGRRTEAEFWAGFEEALPRLFGAILSAVAAGLRGLPGVQLDGLPRMADFAKWGEAACRGIGKPPGEFRKAYDRNRRDAHEATLEDSPLACAVRSFMDGRDGWEGKPCELLAELNAQQPDYAALTLRRQWPKSAKGLSGELRRLAPAFRAAGLDITPPGGGDRRLTLAPVRAGSERAPSARSVPEACSPELPRAHGPGDVRTSEAECVSETRGLEATFARRAHCARPSPALTGDGREVIEL
jgi:hypothetical protein